jgi:hypothetical protein
MSLRRNMIGVKHFQINTIERVPIVERFPIVKQKKKSELLVKINA